MHHSQNKGKQKTQIERKSWGDLQILRKHGKFINTKCIIDL